MQLTSGVYGFGRASSCWPENFGYVGVIPAVRWPATREEQELSQETAYLREEVK